MFHWRTLYPIPSLRRETMRLGARFRGRDPCFQCPHCLCLYLTDFLDILLSRARRHELFRNTSNKFRAMCSIPTYTFANRTGEFPFFWVIEVQTDFPTLGDRATSNRDHAMHTAKKKNCLETSLDGVVGMTNATETQAGGLDPDLSQNGYGQWVDSTCGVPMGFQQRGADCVSCLCLYEIFHWELHEHLNLGLHHEVRSASVQNAQPTAPVHSWTRSSMSCAT